MNYAESFNILGVEVKQVPCICGEGEPSLVVPAGNLYLDTANGEFYFRTETGWEQGGLGTLGIEGIGHGLKIDGENYLAVDTADDFHGDNTKPATANLVQTVVGNIDVLLSTI